MKKSLQKKSFLKSIDPERLKKLLKCLIATEIGLVIILLSVVYFDSVLHNEIIVPAYMSVKHSCNPETHSIGEMIEDAKDGGFVIQGYYSRKNDTITILEPDPSLDYEDDPIVKHERCHQRQYKEGYLYDCNFKLFYLFNEIQCYIAERR